MMDLEHLLSADYVVYKSNCVCKVEGLEERVIAGTLDKRNYLVLVPMNKRESKTYVPADNEILIGKIRKALTKEEIDNVLMSVKGRETPWQEDRKARSEYFKSVINDGNHMELILMIRCIMSRKQALLKSHRKISGQDDSALQNAVKMISEEFAFSLGITKDAVAEYVRNALD